MSSHTDNKQKAYTRQQIEAAFERIVSDLERDFDFDRNTQRLLIDDVATDVLNILSEEGARN